MYITQVNLQPSDSYEKIKLEIYFEQNKTKNKIKFREEISFSKMINDYMALLDRYKLALVACHKKTQKKFNIVFSNFKDARFICAK